MFDVSRDSWFVRLAVWKTFEVRRAFDSAIALLAGVFLAPIATAKKNKQYLTCQSAILQVIHKPIHNTQNNRIANCPKPQMQFTSKFRLISSIWNFRRSAHLVCVSFTLGLWPVCESFAPLLCSICGRSARKYG